MKKYHEILFSSFVAFFIILSFNSCKKINEATQLGDDLIPPIDNVNTFEISLKTITNNSLFNDSTKLRFTDDVALGHISNDSEFGRTSASVYFNILPVIPPGSSPKIYPFFNKDSNLVIDSVILSLSYRGNYGDSNSMQTVRVFEIAQTSNFSDDSGYKFTQPDIQTTGGQLGAKTFAINTLNDSVQLIRKKDTTRVGNVLRIPLNKTLGERFALYDTSNSSIGGYRSDSIFFRLFRGLAVKADATGNGLAYFNLSDQAKTKLIVYFRVTKNGITDTTSTDFYHLTNGQANIINRSPANGYASYLNNTTADDDKIYLQSEPGSLASIKIPGLDTLRNHIIHRAELIISMLPSSPDNKFIAPPALFLDKITSPDSAYSILDDVAASSDGSVNFGVFGGLLKLNNTYRFNITRHVQSIITKKDPNSTLRLYAPLRTIIYTTTELTSKREVSVLPQIAFGRVVLAGGSFADPSLQMRLRVVYSKL
ncbi:MAG: DUF4270 family protein [Chitinophagaceae bacterium]